MDFTGFASPYPQTPTPGGSATANQLNRPPLTSLKPFGGHSFTQPLPRKQPNTPHPLAQVSMIDSFESIPNQSSSNQKTSNNITLRNHDDRSLEDDLLAFEQEQRNPKPIISRASHISDDLTEDDNDFASQTTTIDDDDDDQSDSDSFRIGLSSLSPPGIGRTSHHPGQLSTVTIDPEDDEFTYPQEFSRDLSALSLSPIRRPSAPTPQRAYANDQDLSMDDQVSQTPISGFVGVARQLKRDLEPFSALPIPGSDPKNKDPARGGTLKGAQSANHGIRAKRVFGSEQAQGLKPPRLNQLHSVGLTSTPPAKLHGTATQQDQNQNQQRSRNIMGDLKNQIPSRAPANQFLKPKIRIVDATSDSNHQPDFSLSSGARKIVGNSVRVPDVTGLTDALCSPEKVDFPAGNTRRPSNETTRPDPTLVEALTLLRRRLGSLETENDSCKALIQDLQSQLNRANQPAPAQSTSRTSHDQPDRSSEVAGLASIEGLLKRMKAHTRQLNKQIEAHAVALDELNGTQFRQHKVVRQGLRGVKTDVQQWSEDVEEMKDSLEGLTSEVREIRGMVERLAKSASQSSSVDNQNIRVLGPSQPGMSRRGTTTTTSKTSDPKIPISKPHPPAVKRHLPTTSSSSQQPVQSQQTRHEIEDWRSQTSTIQNSGQSFIGADEIQQLQKGMEEEQRIKQAALKARPHPSNENGSNTRPAPGLTKPVNNRAPAIRTSSAPTMKFKTTLEPIKVTDDVSRGEAILNSIPRTPHDDISCSQCRLRRLKSPTTTTTATLGPGSVPLSGRTNSNPVPSLTKKVVDHSDSLSVDNHHESSKPAPQIVLVGILKDMESDFQVHRKIFVELSDTYKNMNPALINNSKRKALAKHLHESVDTLEKKAGQIKDLYDLLHVKDLHLSW
ncbi:hypothetical protein MJO28_010964 [Puccinia striiformis f. sp. tritici]|uniref:Uncharacterized protein n=1 Tax=Puccinia striiformis f. sp. tritici TaxID=168172 RepID=A0ACC0E5Y2_9BASI|nr:hypothetical protein MJO28_010964 [Puccinia striiformis f. sp. tritici]